QTRSFCYVDDLIRGLVSLAESGEHLPVNIGNPNEFSMNDLAETVLRVTGSKSEVIHEALPVDDPQVRQPDITRARQLLGWEPEDPAYDWSLYDRADHYAAQYGIKLLFTILFTPKWAGRGSQNDPPNNMNDLRNFAYAAAERYSGHYIAINDNNEEPLPEVKMWLAWNEPNNPLWLK